MPARVVITGIGSVTPLGSEPREILRRIEAGESAAASPSHFDASPFSCRVCAMVPHFEPNRYVPEPKLLRLMNREAQLAVAAAHLALTDAGISAGREYLPDDIGLYGATGLSGLPLADVAPLIRASTRRSGQFDPDHFGAAGLKAVNPLLSFKILGNMPVCFVSITAGIQGPNAIYTPWEGQGARAIAAGVQAIRRGDARCSLVGGSDFKAHELAVLTLEQLGVFAPWRETGVGPIPAEGAVFLVIEDAEHAANRGARPYAAIADFASRVRPGGTSPAETEHQVITALRGTDRFHTVVSGRDHAQTSGDEVAWASDPNAPPPSVITPKPAAGNLFAAAAALQVAIGALLVERSHGAVLANCFGYGSEQAAFRLEPA